MSQEHHPSHSGAAGTDKVDIHYRQQLSALIDGALAPDEARFLLRRLQHDDELSGCYERWQLCGDVMRGQVRRSVDAGFHQRIAAAIADVGIEAVQPVAAANGRRPGWVRWGGGGAALAASVAVVAMFVARQQDPLVSPDVAPMVAEQRAPAAVADQAPTLVAGAVTAAAPVAVASVETEVAAPRVQRDAPAPRPSSRPVPVQREPLRAVAAATPTQLPAPRPAVETGVAIAVQDSADPFASSAPLQARPWPRAALPQAASGAFNASVGDSAASGTFYPFEPRLPAGTSAAALDLPAPPPDDAPPR